MGFDIQASGFVILGAGLGGLGATIIGKDPRAILAGTAAGWMLGEKIGEPFRNISTGLSVFGTVATGVGDLVAGETKLIPGGIQVGAATVDSLIATGLGLIPESIISGGVSATHFFANDIFGPSIPCTGSVSITGSGVSGCR